MGVAALLRQFALHALFIFASHLLILLYFLFKHGRSLQHCAVCPLQNYSFYSEQANNYPKK